MSPVRQLIDGYGSLSVRKTSRSGEGSRTRVACAASVQPSQVAGLDPTASTQGRSLGRRIGTGNWPARPSRRRRSPRRGRHPCTGRRGRSRRAGRLVARERAEPAPGPATRRRSGPWTKPTSVPCCRGFGVPALVVHGELDERAPIEVARALRGATPRAELVVIPGAGHLGNVEAPEVFNGHVCTFLTRAAGGSPFPPAGRGCGKDAGSSRRARYLSDD